MFKNKFKKLTGLFLAAVMTLVALPIQTLASDWGVGDNVYAAMLGNYIGSDGKPYADKYNYDYIYYKSDGSVGVATRYASTHAKLGISKNGVTQQAICIEAGVSYSTGSSYVGKDTSDKYMQNLPDNVSVRLKFDLLCGFNSSVTKSPVANTNLDDFSFATQIISWEIQQGLRTGYGKSDLAVNSKIPNTPKTAYYDQLKGRPAEKCYEYILNKMKAYSIVPSFTVTNKAKAPTHTMEYNSSTKKYSITLPDNNKSNMPASAFNIPGVTVTKSGYDYTFSTSTKISGTKACTYKANRTTGKQLVVWKSSGGDSQTMADGIDDPVQFYANFKTSDLGTVQIKKVWQHNGDQTANNSDIYFTIKNSAGAAVKGTGSAGSYTYSASGSVSQFRLSSSDTFLVKSLPTGTYTVTEHGSTDYTISGGASKTVTVPVGGTGVVTFTNARNTGSLRVQKSFSDADNLTTAQLQSLYKSLKFAVKNSDGKYVTAKATSSDGVYTFSGSSATPQYYTVNSNGAFRIDEVPTGSYAITETACDNKYTPAHVTVTAKVTSNATVTTNYPNNRNTGSLRVQKSFSDADNLTTAQLQSLYKSLKFSVKNSDGKYVTAKATSSDGVYTFSGSSTTPQYYTVNSNGAFRIDKVPTGSYVITETAWDNKYTPAHVTVTAKVTSNATVTSDYPNNRNTGTGRVTKTLDNASALTADEKKDIYASIRFTVKTADGKYVTASATASSGVYTYTGTSNTALEYKINSNGVFRIDKIPTGTYALTETSCDDNYTPSVATKKFTVRANETTQVSYENTRDKGSLRVQKLFSDADNLTTAQKQELYKTLKFTVKNSDGKYVTAKATSSDGVYTFSGSSTTPQYYTVNIYGAFRIDKVPTGSYVITETAWDNKYTPAHVTVTAKVTSNATVTSDYPNNRNTGTGRVTKTLDNASALTADEKKDIYASIRFTVKTADGKYVTASATASSGVYTYTGTSNTALEYKINSNGVFRIDKIPTGTYALTETSCDDNYTPSVATKKFTVRANETTQVSYENTRDKGNGRIYKKWVSADTLTKDQIITLGNNVYFTVKTADGKYVTAKATSSDGVYNYTGTASTVQKYKLNTSTIAFRIDNMPTGTYTVTEYCSADGFNGYTAGTSSAPTTQTKTITVVKGATKSVKFTNKSVPIVVIRKHFSDEDNLTDEELKAQYAKVTVNLQVLGIAGKVQSTPPAGYYVNFTGSNGNYTFKDVTATKSSASDLKLDDNGEITISFGTNTTPYYMSVIENYSGTDYETDNRDQRIDLGDGNPNTVIELDDIEINNQLKSGSVQIDKEFLNENGAIENITDEQLAEVTFKIAHNGKYLTFTGADGAYTYNGENNAGTALKLNKSTYNFIASKLPAKEEYTVMEVSGTMGYSFSIDPVTFTITPAGTVKKVFTNRAMTGTISIVKHSADGVLSGWQFRVTGTAKTGQSYDKTFTTDANGTITISNIRIGDYKVTEVKTDKTFGYITEDSKDIEVKTDTVKTVNFTNKPYANIVINKVDSVTNAALSGVTFGIFTDADCENPARAYTSATDDTLIDAVITESATGKYTCNFLPIESNDGTTYYVKEISAPEHYAIDTNIYPVTLSIANSTVAVSNSSTSQFINVPLGNVHVTKVDKDYPDNKLTGAEFTVYKSDKSTVYGNLTEVATGEYQLDEIPAGVYYLKETKAPLYYNIDNTYYQFVILNAGEVVNIETNAGKGFENDAMTGSISVVKHSADGKLSGWQFRVTGTAKTGQSYDKIFTTDANGTITISNIRIGDYKVTEVKNGKTVGYITEDGKDLEVKTDTVTTVNFENKPYANIVINKIDSVKGTALSGATFGIYSDADCKIPAQVYTSETDDTLIDAVITEAATGKYTCNFLPIESKDGTTYYVKELKAPEHYAIDTNVYPVTLSTANTTVAVSNNGTSQFVETPLGSVRVEKVDADHPDNKLTGAEFTVYNSDTSTYGKLTEISKGIYQLDEIPAGTYYLRESRAPMYYNIAGIVYKFEITEAGKVVNITIDGNDYFPNAPMKGNLKIVKRSADGALSGWKFEVSGTALNGTPVATKTYTTDAKGEINISGILIGDYTVKEVIDGKTVGYITPANQTVKIDCDTVSIAEFENKPFGHIIINKVDAKTGEKVTGASFGIFTDSACKTAAKAYKSETDSSLVNAVITEIENGKYTCNFLPIGNAEGTVYYIKELTAPDGYYLDKNTYAVVLKTANATVSIDNEFGKSDFNEYPYGHATIIKEWKLDNSTADMTADEIAQMKAELEKGLYFTVKNSNGKYITATGADGVYKYNSESATEFRYILKNGAFVIAELPTGEYTVTEYSALPDYTIKSENPVKITVVRNQTAKATFVNERDTGTGKVIKVWKQFDTMTAAEQTEIEKNVYFTVTDSNGAYLKVKESNGSYIYCGAQKTETKFVLKNGAFVIAELPTGEYTVTEFNNAKDYSPKQQTQKIKIAKNTAAVLTFTNIRDTGNASIVKKWTNPNGLTTAQKATLEQNVYFTVKNADGTYLKAVSKNGKYVYNGSQTAEARFMLTNGKFELAELPTGKYTITEINNAVGYLPKTQVKTITVTKDATVSAEFVNKVIVGNVTLTKVDEDYPENKLTGAVFTVYKSDKKTVVGTMKETETGVYSLEGLVYGEYYVQETKAPKYFVRDVNFYYFQIVNDGETVEVSNDELGKGTFINAPQKGEIKIVKTSYDKKVEGFHFEVTGKTYTGQDFKKTYTTDKNGIIRITDLRAGEYTIHEIKDTASAGYVLPADVQLTIDRDGAVATAEMYNGNNPPSGVRNDGLQTVLIIISAVALSASAILISPRKQKQHKH